MFRVRPYQVRGDKDGALLRHLALSPLESPASIPEETVADAADESPNDRVNGRNGEAEQDIEDSQVYDR
jgi:hypothetical protein